MQRQKRTHISRSDIANLRLFKREEDEVPVHNFASPTNKGTSKWSRIRKYVNENLMPDSGEWIEIGPFRSQDEASACAASLTMHQKSLTADLPVSAQWKYTSRSEQRSNQWYLWVTKYYPA